MNILDQKFRYTSAASTDIRKTFARVRRAQKRAEEQRLEQERAEEQRRAQIAAPARVTRIAGGSR